MQNQNGWIGFKMGFDGVTIGGGGGSGGAKALKVMSLSILIIILSIITLGDYGLHGSGSQPNLDKEIPFKCTHCSTVAWYKIRDLQKMFKTATIPGPTTSPADPLRGLMMGPMTLNCPKCGKKTLTQAVECPKCQFIFVMQMDPAHNKFDDKCPKCGVSYAKAWQEKYRKEQGTE
jgi:rRNA maturation protein Nop10